MLKYVFLLGFQVFFGWGIKIDRQLVCEIKIYGGDFLKRLWISAL